MQKVIAKINLKAVQNNARAFRELTKVKLCAVVKANAYGHGASEVVNALSGIADCFAVALIEEGIEIRQAACGKEILVFTPPMTAEETAAIAENSFVATVGDLKTARLVKRVAERLKKPIKVHLKINTGMNRYGMNLSMLGKVCKLFLEGEFVQTTGLYSHLYGDEAAARKQRELFVRAKMIAKGYFPNLLCHLSATHGSLLGGEFLFDMTRVGIGLYGYLPENLGERARISAADLSLEKSMKVYARVALTRKYSFGGLGYGKDADFEKGERVQLSLLRVGYADGFLRKQQNGVEGEKKNANALCMDACVRFGRKARGRYELILSDADETAKKTGTISYEVLCAATRRAQFVYEYE